jgi:hypothetical protein
VPEGSPLTRILQVCALSCLQTWDIRSIVILNKCVLILNYNLTFPGSCGCMQEQESWTSWEAGRSTGKLYWDRD